MTAKEIATDASNHFEEYGITDIGTKALEYAIKQYAKGKCKEQRELCSEEYDDRKFPLEFQEGYEGIKNAPEPEFE